MPRQLGTSLWTGPERPTTTARAAAAVSVGCGLLHALLLAGSPAGWLTGVHAAVLLACVPCAVHLWRRPGPAAWAAHATVALLMLAVHPLTAALSPAGHAAHLATGPAPASGLTAVAATGAPLLALLSLGIAGVARAGGWLRPQSSGASGAGGAARRVPQA